MLYDILRGFITILDPVIFFWMILGVIIGVFLGILPGLGGTAILALLLPMVYGMDQTTALTFLLSALAVSCTGGSISAVLINTPGTGPNAATVLDGFPMAQKGQAARGLGNALTASLVGGLYGAIALGFLMPVLKPILLAFGPPEFFMLVLLGICFIGGLRGRSLVTGLIAGGLGLILSLVGYNPITGEVRFSLGLLYFYDGIKLLPFILGTFAIAEIIDLGLANQTIAPLEINEKVSKVSDGVKDVFVHWWLTIRCAVIGVVVGVIPGLGGEVATFVSYGHAQQTSKNSEQFGKGCPEGVIAPESANNAKESGALVPTLAFGIPGSSSMAVLLGALLILGITPGPSFVVERTDLIGVIVATMAASNVIGGVICLAFASTAAKVTRISSKFLLPAVFSLVSIGAFAMRGSIEDVFIAYFFGIIGYVMKKVDFPRPALLLGLILGRIAEVNFHLSIQRYGTFFFFRPISLIILLVLIISILIAILGGNKKNKEKEIYSA